MTRREFAARILLLLIVVGLPTSVFIYQFLVRPTMNQHRVIDIAAVIPENGGFQPNSIQVNAGETVTLRFTSTDVTHGIAIAPGLGIDLGNVEAGHIKEVTLTFDHAGTYTFYCNTWCSPNHWRMRGVLSVRDPQHPDLMPTAQPDAVIQALSDRGIDIDHPPIDQTDMQAPSGAPSAQRGSQLATQFTIPSQLEDLDWRRTHSALQGMALLLTQNPSANEADLADVVAYLWTNGFTSAELAAAKNLYDKNCAACHGETGDGNGFMVGQLVATPVAFADPAYLYTRRMDVLYAKIRRGGMGTDMPNFGTLFTPDETWALVDYLWTLMEPHQIPRLPR